MAASANPTDVVLPQIVTESGFEIMDDMPGSGVQQGVSHAMRALNDLYLVRSNIINDSRHVGDPILASTGSIAKYRPRVVGGSDLAEKATAYVQYIATSANPGETYTIALRYPNSAGGTTTKTITEVHPITKDGWYAFPAITDLADDTESLNDVQLEITVDTLGTQQVDIRGFSLYYTQSSTTLPNVPAGQEGYTGSGIVPLSRFAFAGEMPLSTCWQFWAHKLAEYLYTRGHNAFGFSQPHDLITAGDGTVLSATPPLGVTTLRVWFHVTTATGKLSVTVDGDVQEETSPALGWNSIDVTVVPGRRTPIYLGGESCIYDGACGYWQDGSL